MSGSAIRVEVTSALEQIQSGICEALEGCDGRAKFNSDKWERTDLTGGAGGGGLTRVLSDGAVFEKGGVNFSEVFGTLPKEMSLTLTGTPEEAPFYALGTSVVIHPHSPHVPTIHSNIRYLEVRDKSWFGGGLDLTPSIFYEEDAVSFHSGLKKVCDRHDPAFYPLFKKQCDEYFFIPHRKESRGIGGIFFDYLGRDNLGKPAEFFKAFALDVGFAFNDIYLPIVERRKNLEWSKDEKRFQLLRRGRYVEFNLIYDRGTLFGLKTGGRVESILMSLPKNASWEYGSEPEPGTNQEELTAILRTPREWVKPSHQPKI